MQYASIYDYIRVDFGYNESIIIMNKFAFFAELQYCKGLQSKIQALIYSDS